MSYDIHHGDILDWCAGYDGLLPALLSLYLSISTAMARIAECNEVRQVVRLFVSLHAEQPEWTNVMHALTRITAILTGIIIAFQGFAALRLPVGAAIVVAAVYILWVIQTMSVFISAGTRAVLAAPFMLLRKALCDLEYFAAIQAGKRQRVFGRTCSDSRVLAFRRTMKPAPIRNSTCLSLECLSAMPASKLQLVLWGYIGSRLTLVRFAHTCN